MNPLMPASVAAPKLGMKPRTLLDKAKRGEIRHVRDGRLVRFADEHLEEYRRTHTVDVAPPPAPLPARNPRYTR